MRPSLRRHLVVATALVVHVVRCALPFPCNAMQCSYGYSNIFVTSPNPENLSTLFEFLFKGADARVA